MIRFRALSVLTCLTALCSASSLFAATIHHTDVADFAGGRPEGAAAVMGEATTPAAGPQTGGVGILPGLGASILNDDFSYADLNAARVAGWRFLLPNAQPDPPSSISFTGSAARLRVSKPQDLLEPGSKNSPVLLVHNQPITGDFIAETKLNFPDGRVNERSAGIFISEYTGDPEVPVSIDNETRYMYAAAHRLDVLNTVGALFPGGVSNYSVTSYPGDTWIVRVVKRGAYFYTFFRNSETAPWVFTQWIKIADLANKSLVVSVMGKSFGTITPEAQFQNIDFDYFRVNAVGALTGTFSNVMDGGAGASWQTVSMETHSMQGVKYQLRAGNTLSGGTLTDAGTFAGPDGTANTYFEDDVAQVVPNGAGKRYLEYKLFLDQTPVNLPAFVRRFSAVVQPAGVNASLASSGADFGTDSGGLEVQPGLGDLSLRRTQIFLDTFDNPNLESSWYFDPGYAFIDPTAIGEYSLSERPGYFRMKVGYPQDFHSGDNELGGVKLLRDLPLRTDGSGLPISDFEVETEVTMEVQQSRQAALWLFQNNDNNVGISVARRNSETWEIGILEQTVLNNSAPLLRTLNYGSNTMQMRVTKQGQIVTFSVRDTASPSPSWRVVHVRDVSGAVTGTTDFQPIQVGILSKSFGLADRGVVNEDFDYFKISTLSTTGTRDMPVSVPPTGRVDTVLALGEALTAQNARFQVHNGTAFVGPDGTAGTFFTADEPKLPSSLDGKATQLRVVLDNTTPSGTPYLHAAGIQYVTGDTRIIRDTNRADFAAGTGQNTDVTTTPGVVANAGGLTPGTPQNDPLNYSTNDPAALPWNWVNPTNPNGQSTFSFTEAPGFLRLHINTREDIGTGARYRAFLHRDEAVSGDWEIETLISFPNGRESGRITGIGVYQDNNNMILLGVLNDGQIAQRSFNGSTSIIRDTTAAGLYMDQSYYLKVRKTGQVFTTFVKAADGFSDWVQLYSRTYNGITTPFVGLMAHSASPAVTPDWPADYDYFTFTPLVTEATYESRVLDMGAANLTPSLTVAGTGLNLVRFQFRAADTAGLASQPYVGPDGTAGTFYTGNTTGLLAALQNKRYVQYKVVLPVGTALNDVSLIGLTSTATPLTRDDAILALRIAGGLVAATTTTEARLDVEAGTSANRVDLLDAVRILRSAMGG